MRKILITGAKGFIGKNLVAHLEKLKNTELLEFDVGNSLQELADFALRADYIFHLAGVNRPTDVSEFDTVNRGFTAKLVEVLEQQHCKAPVLISSSIQADLENHYGSSKAAAEGIVFAYAQRTEVPVYIYRLPNVFGKWCLPNYNSVVATFCHNIARRKPVQINNPAQELKLVYIDDVIAEFINALEGKANRGSDGYCYIKKSFQVTLQQLADQIFSYAQSHRSLEVGNSQGDFDRYLYATYLSYLPPTEFSYKLDMQHDTRGWLAEIIKSTSFGQIFVSRTKPGIARGNHWHHTKVEKFLVIDGSALIKLRQINGNEVIEFRVSGKELKVVDIPVGYTHSITNVGTGDLITLFWANEIFNLDQPDTNYLEV